MQTEGRLYYFDPQGKSCVQDSVCLSELFIVLSVAMFSSSRCETTQCAVDHAGPETAGSRRHLRLRTV